jgi:outer membrane autotransporter protein
MHEFEPYRTINPSFIAAPGYDFIINGAVAPRDAARVDAGWNFSVSRTVGLFTNFDGEFSGRGNAYSGSGGFRISW